MDHIVKTGILWYIITVSLGFRINIKFKVHIGFQIKSYFFMQFKKGVTKKGENINLFLYLFPNLLKLGKEADRKVIQD